MPKANEKADRRRPQRALSPDELSRLIQAACEAPARPKLRHGLRAYQKKGTRPTQKLMGPDKAALYAFMAETGLRVNEVRLLKVADLCLDGPFPHVRLRADTAKNGNDGIVPIRSDLVAMLRERIAGRAPDDTVFDIPADLITWFHSDCRRAGISRRDAAGFHVDLHALRLTFGSYLAAVGVPLTTAQKLMRHSDPKLTANVYTDPRILDLAGAVEATASVVTKVVTPERHSETFADTSRHMSTQSAAS